MHMWGMSDPRASTRHLRSFSQSSGTSGLTSSLEERREGQMAQIPRELLDRVDICACNRRPVVRVTGELVAGLAARPSWHCFQASSLPPSSPFLMHSGTPTSAFKEMLG